MAVLTETIEDIEDSLVHGTQKAQVTLRPYVEPAEPHTEDATADQRQTVPGTQLIWVKTFGCSHNQSDSEYMMGLLQAYGYRCSPCQIPSCATGSNTVPVRAPIGNQPHLLPCQRLLDCQLCIHVPSLSALSVHKTHHVRLQCSPPCMLARSLHGAQPAQAQCTAPQTAARAAHTRCAPDSPIALM